MNTEEIDRRREDAYFAAFPVAIMMAARVKAGLIELDGGDMECLNKFRRAMDKYIPRDKPREEE